MTCATGGIKLLSLLIIALVFYPGVIATSWAKWVILGAAILIMITAWTGCRCTWCENISGAPKSKKRK